MRAEIFRNAKIRIWIDLTPYKLVRMCKVSTDLCFENDAQKKVFIMVPETHQM